MRSILKASTLESKFPIMAVLVSVMPSVNCLKPLNSMTKTSEASNTR